SGYNALQGTMVYNPNGNMTDHPDRKMKIIYNYLNLPNYISVNEGLIGISNTSYTYRADGTKVSKTYSMNGSIETNYLDGFQYDNRHAYDTSASLYTIPVLKFVPTSEGYYDFTENKYIYNYTDHLGNVRVSYKSNASGGTEIIDVNNYYPFGLKHQESPITPVPFAGVPYNYKYNGKELQETGMYDYGARMYMPDLGRWGVVDPLAEMYQPMSTYHMSGNNPILFVDSNGMNFDDYKLNQDGTVDLIQKTNDKSDTLYATDKKGNVDTSKSVTVQKATKDSGSIIGDLAKGGIPDNTMRYDNGSQKAFPLGVNRARTTNASDAANVFVFAANNSNVEWGLAGYNTGKNMTYALWTGHSEDMTPNSILYQGISKLSFEIHSHPGSTTVPSPVNGMTEGDYGAAAWVDSEFAKNKNYPRHFMYSKQGKHLWEYNYYNETSSKFYPGSPGVKKPMPVGSTINLKTLRK
ncbi:RHS repeat-associated core domain-containing protein, partial [Chryseobacterium sediminis]|uniref:RHS repeat-associated core domain-containing protein n=1 Tax=Chryseobacterium sediminis TaxID=1679494 RepID=UPI00285DA6DE